MADDAAMTPPDSLRTSVLAGISTIRPLPPEVGQPRTEESAPEQRGADAPPSISGGLARRRSRRCGLRRGGRDLAALGRPDTPPRSRPPTRCWPPRTPRRCPLDFKDGSSATVYRSKSKGKAVILTDGMAAPPSGKVYELWLQDSTGTMVPAGLMPKSPNAKVLLKGDAAKANGGRDHRRAGGRFEEPRPPSRSPCSTSGRTTRDQSRPRARGGRRQRRRRADGCARARQAVPRDALRGRQPARRSRGHPPRRRPRRFLGRRHRLHRAQRAHLPAPAAALRRARRADPGLRDVDVGARRHATIDGRPGVRRRARPVRAVPLVAQRRAAVVPADARRDPALPPDGEATAGRLAERPSATTRRSAAFLERGRFSPLFRTHFMESLVACVWSCDPAVALDYPARYLFTFLEHHGMLGVFGSPQWRTVTGGSREYVERVAARAARRTHRHQGHLGPRDARRRRDHRRQRPRRHLRRRRARHPPGQALAMLAEPTPAQREVLARDARTPPTPPSCTPTPACCRGCRAPGRPGTTCAGRPTTDRTVTVSYDMTRLMRLPERADGTRFIVTLGGEDLVDQAQVIDTMEYEHPIYTPASVAAQRRLPECDTDRIVLAGAWHGWGFHEDGARSGVAARPRGSAPTGKGRRPLPVEATTYATTIRHTRRTPFKRTLHPRVAHLAGRPRPPARPRRARPASRRATTSATPTARSSRTSSTSSPSTASRPTAAGS